MAQLPHAHQDGAVRTSCTLDCCFRLKVRHGCDGGGEPRPAALADTEEAVIRRTGVFSFGSFGLHFMERRVPQTQEPERGSQAR